MAQHFLSYALSVFCGIFVSVMCVRAASAAPWWWTVWSETCWSNFNVQFILVFYINTNFNHLRHKFECISRTIKWLIIMMHGGNLELNTWLKVTIFVLHKLSCILVLCIDYTQKVRQEYQRCLTALPVKFTKIKV
jgi:hypothetical protein